MLNWRHYLLLPILYIVWLILVVPKCEKTVSQVPLQVLAP